MTELNKFDFFQTFDHYETKTERDILIPNK